jgi:hypothetical protein
MKSEGGQDRIENCTSNLETEKNVAIAKEAINLHYVIVLIPVAYSDRITGVLTQQTLRQLLDLLKERTKMF